MKECEALVTWEIDVSVGVPDEPTPEDLRSAALTAAQEAQKRYFDESTPWLFIIELRGKKYRVDLCNELVQEAEEDA